jgi:hypothetical protein
MAEGNNLYLLAGVGALMGLHYWAMGREEEGEDFSGIALSNPVSRRAKKSSCVQKAEALRKYEYYKEQKKKAVKDAGVFKSKSEKYRIDSAHRSMKKYKAEYNNLKTPCAEEEAKTVAAGHKYTVEQAMKQRREEGYKTQDASVPRGEKTQRLYDKAVQKKKAYVKANEDYKKSRGKSSVRKIRDEAKKAYNIAARSYKAARKKELAEISGGTEAAARWASSSPYSQSSSRHPSESTASRSSRSKPTRSSSAGRRRKSSKKKRSRRRR